MTESIKVLDHGEVAVLDWMGDDAAICAAARISYSKGTKKTSDDRALIRYMMRHRHTSPFEAVEAKFYVKAPIFVFRQWHRHRTWSYNEVSGRYSELPEEFYVPEVEQITKQSIQNKQGGSGDNVDQPNIERFAFQREAKQSFANYQGRLELDMRRELARINLPLSTYSEMVAKVDLHNLFHFLSLRLDSHAQYEIRVYAEAIAQFVQERCPLAWEAFVDYRLEAVTLSRLEVEALAAAVRENSIDWRPMALTNQREQQEFAAKLKRLGFE